MPLIVVGLCLASGTTLQVINQIGFGKAIAQEIRVGVETIAHDKAQEFEAWIGGIAAKTKALSIEPGLAVSIGQLASAFSEIANPNASLRPLFEGAGITNDRTPLTE